MPLEISKSKEALGRNIEREREAGKPEDQAIAIAYAKQKEAKERDQKNKNSSTFEDSFRKFQEKFEKNNMPKVNNPTMNMKDFKNK